MFISDNEISKTAGLGSRYSDASLRGVILDIHFMSLCDYLVCTFSSQVRTLCACVERENMHQKTDKVGI